MKYEYYLHRSGGILFDHFGGIGTPFKVSAIRGILSKWFGWCLTPARPGSSTKSVYTRAALVRGVGRHSHFMGEIRKGNYNRA